VIWKSTYNGTHIGMKFILSLLLLSSAFLHAQQKIKVKREDNRFLFFQTGLPGDTLLKHKNDLFVVKFPDSLQHHLVIYIQNAQLTKAKNDSLFRLVYVPGMKYSLSKPDTAYIPLVEGTCESSKTITIQIKNTATQKVILRNNFIVK